MFRLLSVFFSILLFGCSSNSDFNSCLEIARKSLPSENATIVCAKEHEEKLDVGVILDGGASWENRAFKINSLKVKPGYAVTRLKVLVVRSENDPGEQLDIGVFYLFGHPFMYFDQIVKTKTSPSQYEKNWGFKVLEVWGVNVYKE